MQLVERSAKICKRSLQCQRDIAALRREVAETSVQLGTINVLAAGLQNCVLALVVKSRVIS